MNVDVRIGTRRSKLAMWQARHVEGLLVGLGLTCFMVPIDTDGDEDIQTPLWLFNGIGVFTAAVDRAILEDEADLGVHSMKDVPTKLAAGLTVAAILPRGSWRDVVLTASHADLDDPNRAPWTVATSSRRRAAQWLRRYPADNVVPLRGSIQTRMSRLQDAEIHAVIMAEAALDRLDVQPRHRAVLDWMLPAPAQGAICVVARAESPLKERLRELDHDDSRLAVELERRFLRELDGGCSSAIGAIAEVQDMQVSVRALVSMPDGSNHIEVGGYAVRDKAWELVEGLIRQARERGAEKIIEAGRV